jgi:hypothetical protein
MGFWGRHPGEVDELGRQAKAEHDRRASRGERAVRHGVPGLDRMEWWQKGLAWLAVIAVVVWMTIACITILSAPEGDEEPGGQQGPVESR